MQRVLSPVKVEHPWTLAEMVVCADYFKDGGVMLIEQKHMEMVRVPPGWLHAVTNVKVEYAFRHKRFQCRHLSFMWWSLAGRHVLEGSIAL